MNDTTQNSTPPPVGYPEREVVVQMKDIHLAFDGRQILRGIDLTVYRGETLVILGGSGCGKSTLLNCMTGSLVPDRGTVEVLGSHVCDLTEKQLDSHRIKVGFLFQHGALFQSMNVRDNLACVLREHSTLTEEEIDILVKMKLELVGLRHTVDLRPSQLSGGMRKRVALARALVLDPPLMLYDEPGAGLDPVSLAGVDRIIATLARVLGITSLVVTHHMASALRIADRLIFLHGGRVIVEGTPDEFRTHTNPLLRQFLDGAAEGPLTEAGVDDDYAVSLLGKERRS